MITITTTTGSKFYYKGEILIQQDDMSIHIDAYSHEINPDNLYTWDCKVFDLFWKEDIESIRGTDSTSQYYEQSEK